MRPHNDPNTTDWASVELDETWPDDINFKTLSGWMRLFRNLFGQRKPVTLPKAVLETYNIPKYILQEFHNLPNGNYSQRFSRGYITGFDVSMLGKVQRARNWIADKLKHCESVADIGTAGGKTAATIKKQTNGRVWGIDPSPYLLKHAAADHPDIEFLQGTAENLPLEQNQLDGLSICFVLHEIPPKYIRQGLSSFNRCLKIGGLVAIAEPSELQLKPFELSDLRSQTGWLTIYFRWLARFVYEPFLDSWHKQVKEKLAEDAGFRVLEKNINMPINTYLFEKYKDL